MKQHKGNNMGKKITSIDELAKLPNRFLLWVKFTSKGCYEKRAVGRVLDSSLKTVNKVIKNGWCFEYSGQDKDVIARAIELDFPSFNLTSLPSSWPLPDKSATERSKRWADLDRDAEKLRIEKECEEKRKRDELKKESERLHEEMSKREFIRASKPVFHSICTLKPNCERERESSIQAINKRISKVIGEINFTESLIKAVSENSVKSIESLGQNLESKVRLRDELVAIKSDIVGARD